VDFEQDVLKVAVVERHKGTGNIGLGFVHGFGMTQGAIASSVGHDSHNICVVGADEAAMASCSQQGHCNEGRVCGRRARTA
jgi:adenine deaminase